MTIAATGIAASITIDGQVHPLAPTTAQPTLDEGWSPYAQCDLTIALPSQAVFDALDPRTSPRPRVALVLNRDVAPFDVSQSRTFDLLVQDRTLDHVDATVTLALASDEALLQDDALIATEPDTSALTMQDSVRRLVNDYVLAPIGAELEAGDADADFTTLTAATNLMVNPSFETTTSGWASGGNVSGATGAMSRPTSGGYSGAAYSRVTISGTSAMPPANSLGWGQYADFSGLFTVGKTYSCSALVRASRNTCMVYAIEWRAASGTATFGADIGTAVAVQAGEWTQITLSEVVPPEGATVMRVKLYNFNGPGYAAWKTGDTLDVDALMMTEGDGKDTDGGPLPFFDGYTADTPLYNYQWEDAPNASASTRAPVFQRDPDVLTRQPGETMWDFIAPVLTQAGLRLFCDELRVWRLVNSEYSRPGRVTIATGFNVYRASDAISRTAVADDGTPLWFDSVVVKYTWTDTDNQQQVKYDTAAAEHPTKTALIEYNRPYPGPGAAAYILSRVNGQGRVLDLTAALDLTATPGMEAVTTLPFTPVQTGYTSKVAWDFGADEMTVGTRGLIDTPPSAWIRIPPGIAWTDGPVGQSWLDGPVH